MFGIAHLWHEVSENAKAKRETSTKHGIMDVIDCIWSIAPSTYTDTSELNHFPNELVPSQGFQVAVPRL